MSKSQLPYRGSKLVALDERGRPIGEDHHRAKLSDHDVELMRQMYEEGMASYGQLAVMFECSKGQVWGIVNYTERAVSPAGYRRVPRRSVIGN